MTLDLLSEIVAVLIKALVKYTFRLKSDRKVAFFMFI